jgi:signal transduction histidine kinase
VTVVRERAAVRATGPTPAGWLTEAARTRAPWLFLALVAAMVNALIAPVGLVGSRAAYVVLAGLVGAGAGYVWLITGKNPRNALVVVAVSGAVAAAPDMSNLVMLVPLVAVGQVALTMPWRAASILTIAVCLVIAGVHAMVGLDGQNVVRFATLPLIGLFAGALGRQQLHRVQEAERLLAVTQRANEEAARAATLAERARLAREIHDVLAHSLGALAAQLGAADSLLEESFVDGEPHPARQHVRQARQLAAEGLQETRRGIAALRDEPLPVPELLRSLTDTHRAAGHATLSVRGAVRPLPAEMGLAIYRVTQESLANVGKYAPRAMVQIDLDYGSGRVDLTIANGPPPTWGGPVEPGGGFGLLGMRERAVLLGGTLTAGPRDQGWVVALSVPVVGDA